MAAGLAAGRSAARLSKKRCSAISRASALTATPPLDPCRTRVLRTREGWRECGVVIADDLDMAERRFFDNRAALRPAAKPAAMLSPGQLPTAKVGPSHPDIIGLFPEPGGGR